ncbi:MAG: nucleotidyl transferase AbiEii/AbiGii toxin family protein [Calothrix sp. SM1_5_4]|nr:nucleotidyl transferase AbiEii/AbiGii toxin family protein [Calothrix sp. SM1_5_4]
MRLQDTLSKAHEALSAKKIGHALIGGFALAAHGVVRATQDIDLLIDGGRRVEAATALVSAGFSVVHETSEVSHFGGPGHLDVLWANRPPTQEMIRSAAIKLSYPVPVVAAEDLIGLKIQAYKNEPKREFQDKADIQALLDRGGPLNLKKIREYADIFGEWPVIEELLKRI